MDASQIRQIGRSRIMGMCRLFISYDDAGAASKLLSIYMGRDHPYDTLYFLELLRRLNFPNDNDLARAAVGLAQAAAMRQ